MGDAVRGFHLSLSTAQKSRLSRAKEGLTNLKAGLPSSLFVTVGDKIPVDYENGFLSGHGTQVIDKELLATVCGVVERVNKLVSVRPLRSRYNPETGDVVVGRVIEIAPKRWKVDVNSRQDAQLMLSAVNLPSGIQRRRTAVDELNMRDFYTENDLISAEVQSLPRDGSLHLHTRSLKYGKLENGQLVKVPPSLIKRLKQHFHQLKEHGIQLILSCNGYVWIGTLPAEGNADKSEVRRDVEVSLETRERICRFANCVRALGALGITIHPEAIIEIYETSLADGISARKMLSSDFILKVIEREAEKRGRVRSA